MFSRLLISGAHAGEKTKNDVEDWQSRVQTVEWVGRDDTLLRS